MKVKASVIIPVYNGEKYVKKAVESVLEQTFLPKEILIVDDGSTDETEKRAKQIESEKVKINYFKKENGGPNSARNFGLKKSSGDFVAFLDADDIWEKTKLEKQLLVFKQSEYKKLGLVFCDYFLMNATGNLLSNTRKIGLNKDLRGSVFEQLKEGNFVTGSASAILIKKECFEKVGLFDESLWSSEDWDMWLRISEQYNFDYVSEELVGVRQHANNAQLDFNKLVYYKVLFYDKWSRKTNISTKILNKLRYSIYFQMLEKKDFYQKIKERITPEFRKKLFGNYWKNFLTFTKAFFIKMVSLSQIPKLIRWLMESVK